MKRLGLQAKLNVNEPGDIYEQEADRVADQVLTRPVHSEVDSKPPHIQRLTGQANGEGVAPASAERVLASSGRPLDPALRQDMEECFGYDFSGVRIHSGAAAEQSAREVSANAYTVGNNIVLAESLTTSCTHQGRRLLAHELTHTIQQRATRSLDSKAGQERPSGFSGSLIQRAGEFNVPTLDDLYNSALLSARQTGNWQDAAEKLNGFNLVDIHTRLAQLTHDEVGYLHQGALDNRRVGPDSNVAQLTKPGTPRASEEPRMVATVPDLPRATQPARVSDGGAKPAGVLKVGGAVIGNVPLSLATVGGVLVGGQELARGVLTIDGAVLGGGAEVIVVQGGAVAETAEAVKVATEVGGLDATLLRQTLAMRAALAAETSTLAAESTILIAAGGPVIAASIGFAIGVGIVLLPFAVSYAALVLARLGPFGGTLPPGGAPTPPMEEPGDAGEAHAPGSDAGAPAHAPGMPQGGPGLMPGTRSGSVTAPGQSTADEAELGPLARKARANFNKLQKDYAARLGVGPGGEVHHARELNLLDKYPGIYTEDYLNDFKNMRGIAPKFKDELHQGSIRREWNEVYEGIDNFIAERKLSVGTPEWIQFIKSAIEKAALAIDEIYAKYSPEYGKSLKD